ncbi:MAG: hypothetical protein ACRCYC_10425 [Paraclostridium sp.]|uniref:hypothetical protein n=1 Tax=Paraclostridium sp. TaxID=2023273 RepID=UPI003F3217D5
MEYNLEHYLKYMIHDQNNRFEREKAFLKVLMVNQDSDDVMFNYYNFNNLDEIINFIKYIILPSVLLSTSLAEYEELMQITIGRKDLLMMVENIEEVQEKEINTYKMFYDKLSDFKDKKYELKDLLLIIEQINSYYGNKNVFLIVEYSNSLHEYLTDIYLGYKNIDENLNELKEKFIDTDFEIEDLLELLKDVYSMNQDDLEEFLYQIPII